MRWAKVRPSSDASRLSTFCTLYSQLAWLQRARSSLFFLCSQLRCSLQRERTLLHRAFFVSVSSPSLPAMARPTPERLAEAAAVAAAAAQVPCEPPVLRLLGDEVPFFRTGSIGRSCRIRLASVSALRLVRPVRSARLAWHGRRPRQAPRALD
jgi:hypothetical protein